MEGCTFLPQVPGMQARDSVRVITAPMHWYLPMACSGRDRSGLTELVLWAILRYSVVRGKMPCEDSQLRRTRTVGGWSNTVGSILCVARSGEGGTHAQNDAIRIAKDRGEPLVFPFVADSSFLSNLSAPLVVDIKSILESLGRFLPYSAVQRASAEGVQAGSLIRHGVMREVLPIVVSKPM
jgi:hypothetical protein